MRFQFNSNAVEKLLKDTFQILLFMAIVGCPISGSHMEIKAMESASTLSSPPTSVSAASSYSAAITAAVQPTAKDYLETTATSLEFSEFDSSVSSSSSLSSHKNSQIFHSFVVPTSENFNDSNEIDSNNDMDYVMTKHIASHAAAAAATTAAATAKAKASMTHHHHHQQQRTATTTNNNKTQDLSSLSLLSLNETTAATSSNKLSEITSSSSNVNTNTNSKNSNNNNSRVGGAGDSGGIGSNIATIATFQHIGSQRIALKSTTTATSSAAIGAAAAAAGAIATYAGSTAKSNIRISTKKIESKYILPKPQKTDAPMLNYIFDTFSSANKHHHHDQRYGPHFEDVQRVGQPTNMTVQAGSSIHLNCRISLLQDKTVSWVRRNAQGENALDLLTVGLHTYTGDKRYKMEFQYPNNWRLKILNVKKDDEAMYECQISTHPPRVIQINLLVNAPKVMIVDEFGDPLQEKYYEIDSTLQLSCLVRNVAMAASVVYWKHSEDVLNYDVTRGGISVKTELMDDGANSTLFIAKINKADSGNYTCSISDYQNFSMLVHILNGESFAELHHGGAATTCCCYHMLAINLMLLLMLLLCLPKYIHR